MKYNIDIMSKDKCKLFSTKELTDDCIIISINDTGYDTEIYNNKNIIDICKLWFDDIDNIKYEDNDLKLMTKDQGKQIKDFVNKYKDRVKHIVIHCTAGISRSGAVGFVLARYLNGDDKYLWAKDRYLPNKHVYKLMCETLGLEYSDKLFKDRKRFRNRNNHYTIKSYGDYGIDLVEMFE